MKNAIKSIVRGLATLLVLPTVLGYWLSAQIMGVSQAFPGWSQAFGLIPGLTGVYLRQAFYRAVLPRCGIDCCLTFGTILSRPTTEFGRGVYVGAYCCLGDVTLEDDVLIGSHVSVINGQAQHGIERLDVPVREQPGRWPRITIGQDSWIGDRSVIMADVGAHCVIGAGSVVSRPIPDYAIAVGVPARIIGDRRDGENPPVNAIPNVGVLRESIGG